MRDSDVGKMLEIAYDVAKRLPPPRSLGPGNVFRYLITAKDPEDAEEIEYRLSVLPPSPDELALFDYVIEILAEQPVVIRKLIWMRIAGDSYRHIARILGYNPRYLSRLYRATIVKLCTSLAPSGRIVLLLSQEYV